MTDRELFKMALNALEQWEDEAPYSWSQADREAVEALRARLAQPEPEPVAWGVDEGEGRCISLHDLYFVKKDADHMAELKGTHAKVVALYTTPPQREWVGLTDEEAKKTFKKHNCTISADLAGILARAIEAKLKEKNNG